ncbi:MFS transporter [Naumannella cuiyingiana]|uniref:MFS family permease n=1 Tax=Naumannella cuiyingiana TaxID=1347891 RepID=A0A7Z0IJR7_9ACTN|nr:MFS transporter [Naumannella cuiyingiana]NYI69798.1 MFS family permease [Naumannella cuiyingiana]
MSVKSQDRNGPGPSVLEESGLEATGNRVPTRGWVVLGVLIIFMLINYADRTVLALAGSYIIDDLGLTSTQFGFLGSAFYFLFAVSAVLVGIMGSRLPLKWLILGLAILWGITQMPVFALGTWGSLAFSRISLGATEGPASGLSNTVSYTWFPDSKRGLPSAALNAGTAASKIIAGPLIALVIITWNWRAAFLTVALISFAWALLWLFVGKLGPVGLAEEAQPMTMRERWMPVLRAMRTRTFIGLLIVTVPLYGLVAVMTTWFPLYMEKGLGMDEVTAGILIAAPAIGAVLGALSFGALSDAMARRGASPRQARGLLCSGLVALCGGTLVVFSLVSLQGYLAVAVLSLIYGIGMGGLPLALPSVGALVDRRLRSTILGTFLGVQSISGVAAPLFVGIIQDQFAEPLPGFLTSFMVLGGLTLIGGLIGAVMVDPARDSVQPVAANNG